MERPIAVAVVDANPGTRLGLVRRLGQISGLSVVAAAAELREALGVLRTRHADVIVVDPRRIGPDGAASYDEVKAAAREAGVVVLTAYLNERERAELAGAGVQAILLKEIDSETLVSTIRAVAARLLSAGGRSEA